MNFATTKERLLQYLNFKGIRTPEFFKETGIKRGFLDGDKLNSIVSDTAIAKIIASYPDLNILWLITGEGDMIKDNVTIIGDNNNTATGRGIVGSTFNGHYVNIENGDEYEKIIREKEIELTRKGTISQEAQRLINDLKLKIENLEQTIKANNQHIESLNNIVESKDEVIRLYKLLEKK